MVAISLEALRPYDVALIVHVQPAGHRLTMPGALSFHLRSDCDRAYGSGVLRRRNYRLYVDLMSWWHALVESPVRSQRRRDCRKRVVQRCEEYCGANMRLYSVSDNGVGWQVCCWEAKRAG